METVGRASNAFQTSGGRRKSMYQGKYLYTIKKSDVGKKTIKIKSCPTCGSNRAGSITDLMGIIQTQDVGKLIFITKQGTLQVESQEQMKHRVAVIKE